MLTSSRSFVKHKAVSHRTVERRKFLEAWRDPDYQDHHHMRQWAGRSFDPERFDLAKTDKAVRSALRKARKDYIFRRD